MEQCWNPCHFRRLITMDIIIAIPDELAPGVIASSYAENKAPQQLVQEYAIAAATKACQDFKVGPYYQGPTLPRFNADGTPYEAQS
jgi:hypothetical protein